MAVIIMFVFLVCIKSLHLYSYNISLAHNIVVTVHIEKVMTIVLLCESAQQFRALMIIAERISARL